MCKRSVVTIFLFLTLIIAGNAQINAGSSISDQQLIMLWQQAKMAGMTEADLLHKLSKQGMTSGDINSLKKRLSQLQSNMGGASRMLDSNMTTVRRDTAWVKELPFVNVPLPIYGFSFFNSPQQNFQPALNAATPKNYLLGPEDELIISVTGLNETTIRDQINLDGNFSLPYAGMVHLNGLTIEQATQRIKNRLSVAYPALRTGRTQMFLSLGNVRSIRVSVIGEALRQGTYTVSALASFFNVLYVSGGPSANGSLRKIELIRDNKVAQVIDFYSFLQKGILNNIRLEDQDIIRIPVYDKRITISGEVKRPAIYESTGRETLGELLSFAGGFSNRAFTNSVKVVEMGPTERRIKEIANSDLDSYIPKNGDSIFVGSILSRFANRVIISGAVERPGDHELKTGLTLKQLIANAGGLQQDAFLERGSLNRLTSEGERQFISFNVDAVMKGGQELALQKDDSIHIYRKDELRSVPSITVGGAVRSAGVFAYKEGMTIEDVIAMAGGFNINAANHKVEVSRLEKNIADTLANQLIDIIRVNVDPQLERSANAFRLQPLDYVFVPELVNYRVLGNIKIGGEILYPGEYTLGRRDESVTELISRAGGLSPFASLKDVQVYRKGLRIGTDVLDRNTKDGFLLLPGDSIYVPRALSLVEVSGAVFSPQIIEYSSGSFMYYISAAGGVTDSGKLKNAYVQYPNGINKRTKRFLFFRNYPKVTPGSKIIVPQKSLVDLKPKIGVGEISAATAILTALVTLFTVIKN